MFKKTFVGPEPYITTAKLGNMKISDPLFSVIVVILILWHQPVDGFTTSLVQSLSSRVTQAQMVSSQEDSQNDVPVLCNLTGLSCPNMVFYMHQVDPTTIFVNLHEIALIYHGLIDLS